MLTLQAEEISIEYSDLTSYQTFKAIEKVSFHITQGEFVVIVGPSGCGKTSILNAIAGLLPITQGSLQLNGQDIKDSHKNCAMVFQTPALMPWRNVLDNVIYGLELQGIKKKQAYIQAQKYINLVGLQNFEHNFPHQLSGGMQQRVNLARALTIKPNLLLLDEPFSSLDALTREYMQSELQRIWLETNTTIVYVTHLISEAIYLADKILVMSAQPGTIKEIIKINLPRPRGLEIKHKSQFNKWENHIWNLLKKESFFS